jgi:hypothetical protein
VTIVVRADAPGTIFDKASASGSESDPNGSNNGASAETTVQKRQTRLTYDGQVTQDYNDAATVAATLTDASNGSPISGETVHFTLDGQSCNGVTNGAGHASCSITPNEAAGTYTVNATYAGSPAYDGSSASSPFVVTKEETTTTYTGASGPVANGSTATLSGVLKEDGTSPIAGRTLTLTLGTQSCTATTNASGSASCTVTVAQPLGPTTASASFAGDGFYKPSSDSKAALVFGTVAGGGAFVIGDLTPQTSTVTFWGAQWWKLNTLSGGSAPASFKGFAANPSTAGCGLHWTTAPGNSPPPPAGPLPPYMAVIVASSIDKNGSVIGGNDVHVVIVKTNPGYEANPGHAGTGKVVATVC